MRRLDTLVASALVSLVVGAACVDGGGGVEASGFTGSRGPTVGGMARAVGRDVVERLVRGYVPGRSGEIQLVPEPWSVLGQWNGGVRGAGDPRTTHATPWSYHQRVPMFVYGPGIIRAGRVSDRAVDMADVAPTIAELLDLPFPSAGEPLREALLGRGHADPRAIVVVVYDGGGWNVLSRWPGAWTAARRLARAGTAYVNATAGSAPTVTAPVHATLGTGVYPHAHGIVENTVRFPDGTITDVFRGEEGDPVLLERRTVADLWEVATFGEAWVGMVGYDVWHLPMMGTGTPGDDRDVTVLWDRHAGRIGRSWAPPERYRLPSYAPEVSVLDRELRRLDLVDGAVDGAWRGADLGNEYEIPGTPAFATFAGEAARRLVRRSAFGGDDVADLLFVELKATDYAGHLWNMTSPAQRDVLAAQDRIVEGIVRALDRKVGHGRYVLVLTADHGQTPNPASSGGLRIDRYAVAADIEKRFGDGVVEEVHPAQVFLDVDALDRGGATVEDVARFLGEYRYEEAVPAGTDRSVLPPGALDRRVFAAALPGSFLAGLSPDDLASLGRGRFPEGDLTTPLPALERLLRG